MNSTATTMRPVAHRVFSSAVAIVMALALCLPVQALSATRAYAAAADLTISDAAGWTAFVAAVNGGESYAGKTVVLDANIALSGAVSSAGTATNPFLGTFDGQYHTISGLSITPTADNAGLFGVTGDASTQATVKNVSVKGSISVGGNAASNVGGLIGLSQNTVVSRAGADVAITAGVYNSSCSNVGGLIGKISGATDVSRSRALGSIDAQGASNVGGLVGAAAGATTVNACYSMGGIKAGSYAGGLFGMVSGAGTLSVSNSFTCSCPLCDESYSDYEYGGTFAYTVSETACTIENFTWDASKMTGGWGSKPGMSKYGSISGATVTNSSVSTDSSTLINKIKDLADESGVKYFYVTSGRNGGYPELGWEEPTPTDLEVSDAQEYAITAADSTNGTFQVSATSAAENVQVTVTPAAADGYELDAITVTDSDGNEIAVTDGVFTMPASAVTVTVTFKEKEPAKENTFNASAAAPLITTQADMDAFAAAVNGGNTFAGKTVSIAQDADPLKVTSCIGGGSVFFKGTFDGNFNKVELDISGESRQAMFGAVVGDSETAPATIKNLVVTGKVTTADERAAGVIAVAAGHVALECVGNEAIVTASGNSTNYAGGLIAFATDHPETYEASIAISKCYNRGVVIAGNMYAAGFIGSLDWVASCTIADSYNNARMVADRYAGGFIGEANTQYNVVTFSNCYHTGAVDSQNGGAVVGQLSYQAKMTATNSYNDKAVGDHTGNYQSVSGFTNKTADQMKDAAFVGSLGSAFKADSANINGGFPVLQWEPSAAEPEPVEYDITKAETQNGSFTVSADKATAGMQVTVTATPADGYELDSISVADADGNAVEVVDGVFTMPEANVTVTVAFKAKPAPALELTVADDETRGASGISFEIEVGEGRTKFVSITAEKPSGAVVQSDVAGLKLEWYLRNDDGDDTLLATDTIMWNGVMNTVKAAHDHTFRFTEPGTYKGYAKATWELEGYETVTAEGPDFTFVVTAPEVVVDKSALEQAVTDARAAEEGVQTSADGTDIEPEDTWVTEEVKKALDDALAAAAQVLDNEDATQQDVDDAKKAVDDAAAAFAQAKKAGTKQAEDPKEDPKDDPEPSRSSESPDPKDDPEPSKSSESPSKDPEPSKSSGSAAPATPEQPAKSEPAAKPSEPVQSDWERLSGAMALDTMVAIVEEGNFAKDGIVVITTVNGYWDALTAAGLAGLADAPVLMTDGVSLSSQTAQLIGELKPSTIVVCGGTAAVSDAVVSAAVKAAGDADVVRCWGAVATDTANSIFQKAPATTGGTWSRTAFVCTSQGYWDALSAAPVSYALHMPIFLTADASTVSPATIAAMKGNIDSVYIVGGEAALTKDIDDQLKAAGITVAGRLWGATAIETSMAVADYGLANGMSAEHMGIATGGGYWDALSGAALCGHQNSIIVLLNDSSSASVEFVKDHADEIGKSYVFGGEMAVDAQSFKAVEKASE